MSRKTKGLLQLLIYIALLLGLVMGFFIWDAARQHPLSSRDQIMLARGQQGDLATVGISLYNNGRRPIKLVRVQLVGTGWELADAAMASGLAYSGQPLASWAAQHGAALTPISGHRVGKHSQATLGVSLRRTAVTALNGNRLVVTYRLWFFTRELQIALD